VDNNTRAVTDGLVQALAGSGLTQADFAAALGTSASRFSTYLSGKIDPSASFYLRALRLAEALRVARALGLMTPQSTAREVRRSLQKHDGIRALKMTLQARDHLHTLLHEPGADADAATSAWTSTPRSTGERQWDAFFAALTEHEFTGANREPPAWTSTDTNDHPLLVKSLLLSDDEVRASTPEWLSRHGVYAAERDLVTA
jgi:transcriptional regulator with XRE-family HTH domain